MADVRFYHMELQGLEQVLPSLVGKALQGGHKIVVRAPDEGMVEQLNAHLWSHDPNSFIPHGSAKDGYAADQPVWLTARDENPNGAGVLILVGGAQAESFEGFDMVCEMLDGRNEPAIAAARGRWKGYQDSGEHELTYWQQTQQGGWDKKAG